MPDTHGEVRSADRHGRHVARSAATGSPTEPGRDGGAAPDGPTADHAPRGAGATLVEESPPGSTDLRRRDRSASGQEAAAAAEPGSGRRADMAGVGPGSTGHRHPDERPEHR